ncbi:MAG TPA: glycosyltransferase family 4 protein [Myxococcaceae bacterium]|jgi:glycosyltransferase involved in cell wall biosynthesis
MRVCVVGGIFGRPPEYQARHRHLPECVLAQGLRERGVEVETLPHHSFRPAAGRWDLVHVHHVTEGSIRAAGAACGPPLVFTSHGGAVLCGYERSRAWLTAFGYVCRRADALVALSQAEARFLEDRYGLGRKTAVIPNGTDAGVFQLREPARKGGRPTLLYVGQLIPLKGLDVLMRALARLPSSGRPRLRLVYHNAELEPALRALAGELRIEEGVEFCGAMGPEDLAAAYAGSDLLVLPSHAEALPSVVTEAMLCGLPVAASAVGGIPEQLGTLGHLFPPGSVDGLAAALTAALARLPLDAAQRAALRARALAWSGVDDMAGAHLRLYTRLLQERPERPRRARGLADRLVGSAMDLYRLTHPVPWGAAPPAPRTTTGPRCA